MASGGESNGILKLILARLGKKPNDKFLKNGKTTKEVVDLIYSKGRIHAIHGNSDKMGHDWIQTRHLSEIVARLCLVMCLDYLSKNSEDSPKMLMQ